MADIRNYLRISNTARAIKDIYTSANEFSENYKNVFETERKSYLRYFLINNKPFVFKQYPIIYEQIVEYLADNIGISSNDIKLIEVRKPDFPLVNHIMAELMKKRNLI